MRVLRWILCIVMGLAVVAGLGIGAVFYFTRGAVTAAEDFLATIAEAGPAAAYQKASLPFRAAQGEAAFITWAERRGLKNYKSASWSQRSISGGRAELTGTVTLADGATVPASITLTKDEVGNWQVVFLDIQPVGVAAQPGQPPLPDDAALSDLARLTVGELAEAINKEDFATLHAHASRMLQSQMPAEKIRDRYAQFIEKKIDLTPAAQADPVFSIPPAIDADGALKLKGYFSTTQQPWYFEFRYVYEHPMWKLIGLSVASSPK